MTPHVSFEATIAEARALVKRLAFLLDAAESGLTPEGPSAGGESPVVLSTASIEVTL